MMSVELTKKDRECLAGTDGEVQKFAMNLLLRVARNNQATHFIDVSKAHLVGSYHSGPGNIQLLSWLESEGAKVAVPTTLNSSTEDLFHASVAGRKSESFTCTSSVVRYLTSMGCQLTLTCAPYHLPVRPVKNENIAWAESNAVVYANSILGARTNMTYQYLDLCATLTGRMPAYGLYLDENRAGRRVYDVSGLPERWLQDDLFYQLLGFYIGKNTGREIPVIIGLPLDSSEDQLRALGAAAATSGSVQMFHAVGITPEASDLNTALQGRKPLSVSGVTRPQILDIWQQLGGGMTDSPRTVCLGTPHFSFNEFLRLEKLMNGRVANKGIAIVVTTSRYVLEQLKSSLLDEKLKRLNIHIVVDRCCYYESKLDSIQSPVMTPSAKWAYYAPGNMDVDTYIARLEDCIETALAGEPLLDKGFWYE